MKKKIIILGSTGSIGKTVLKNINNQNFKIILLSTNKSVKKLFKQAILYKVKNVIIEDEQRFKSNKYLFYRNNINAYHGLKNIKKIIKVKSDYCVNSISGINGLKPTLDVIPLTKNILIANKESIICGWNLIKIKLKKNKTKFIPIDSEHFSIFSLIKDDKLSEVKQIIITASGGPFLHTPRDRISNIKPKIALKHPNWSMGKKISIDSSTMMNKVFEYIEALKIFNIKKEKLSILIQPSSFIHAIVIYKGNLIKFLAHETNMGIPISNALEINNQYNTKLTKKNISLLNNLKFEFPDEKKFPILSLIKLIPQKTSFFETILITLNDELVDKYLKNQINYISIQKNLLNLIKKPYFLKFYKLKPKSIYDIKNMISNTQKYLEKHIKVYEK
tara:strand:- start:3738 stop:4907 length:1170 start_codon:yes stop_codon:yes gene_type:complete